MQSLSTMVDGAGRGPRVAVVVGLDDRPPVGGHLGVWLRVAEALAALPQPAARFDLLMLRRGAVPPRDVLAEHVRIHRLPALLHSDRLPFARTAAGGTELVAPSPFLLRRLAACDPDVVVISEPFGFGRTAAGWARRNRRALVYAVQTRHDAFAALYGRAILARLMGERFSRWLEGRFRFSERLAAGMTNRIATLMRQADHVFASSRRECDRLRAAHSGRAVSLWRRGVDFTLFNPDHRDRSWLRRAHGIPPDHFVVLFAGRVDESKGVPFLLDALAAGLSAIPRLHLFLAGEGGWRQRAQARFGSRVTAPGALTQEALARVMACADAFAFPSSSDAAANVLREAQASGLPVLVHDAEPVAELVGAPGLDGVLLPAGEPETWAAAIRDLAARDEADRAARRRRIAACARARYPDWHTVLVEDLLPVWRRLVARRPTRGDEGG